MPPRHDAFISYSHAADHAHADAFERGLEQLAKPLLKLRALDIFRDETSLSASPGVWPAIEAHLAASQWLLVLACPAWAASTWCQREILWWLDHRGADTVLVVLTDGAIVWDAAARDFDWARSTALPRAIAGRLNDEPLYVDLSWARGVDGLSLEHPRFRDAVVSVAAPMRGIAKDALDGADIRQQARNRLFVRAGVATIAAAAVVAIWQAKLAIDERAVAEAQRAIAVEQRAEAVQQRDRAEKALAAAERELLRAQSAELRGLLRRVEALLPRAASPGIAQRLQQERIALAARLERSTREHQKRLAAEIGYRGEFEFLQRWEGNVGGVSMIGESATIDPQTELSLARADTIRQRYEFVLTPDELDAVLALVGQRGDAARAAWQAHPVLCRITLQPADVARLVPEVAGEFWRRLAQRYPPVQAAGATPAAQTALLSLAFNAGVQARTFDPLIAALASGDPARLASAIEHALDQSPAVKRFPALKRRRIAEANLVRAEAGLPLAPGGEVPAMANGAPRRGAGC